MGVIFGQAWSATHRPYYTLENRKSKQYLVPTISSLDHGTPGTRKAATINGLSMSLLVHLFFLRGDGMTKLHFAELKDVLIEKNVQQQALLSSSSTKSATDVQSSGSQYIAQAINGSFVVAHLAPWFPCHGFAIST